MTLESYVPEVMSYVLKTCNTIKKKIQYSCLPVINSKVLRAVFYRTPLVPASKCLVLMGGILRNRKLKWQAIGRN